MRAAAGVPPGPGANDVQRVQHPREEPQQRQQDVDDQVARAAGAQAHTAWWEDDREPAQIIGKPAV